MARRKRSSWGCVQRVSSGVYRLRWMQDGKRRSETVRGTRREADDRLAALRVECGSSPSRRPVTVAEVYEGHYLPDLKSRAVEGTVRGIECAWRVHVGPRWGETALQDVHPLELQEWLLTLTKSGAKVAVKLLNGVWRMAMLLELADRSPLAAGLRLPERTKLRRTRAVIARGDMEAYYEAALDAGLGAVFLLGACCGLRVGESLGVRVGEVVGEESGGATLACVPVVRQVSDSGEVLDRLKTGSSSRWSVVGEPWASRLLALQEEARGRGDEWLTDDGLKRPRRQADVRRQWERVTAAAGLERVPLQNLRPTFASNMEGRAPVESIARLMGHSRPTITYQTYERPDRATFVALAAAVKPVD